MVIQGPFVGATGLHLRREFYDQIVLDSILQLGRATRPELAERANLSIPTISEVVRNLVATGLIREDGKRVGGRGRMPTYYVLNQDIGYVIGVYIGELELRFTAANLFGELLIEAAEPIQDISSVADAIHEWIAGFRHERLDSQLLAVALAVREDHLSEWITFRIPAVTTIIGRAVQLAAIGERWRGLAVQLSDFIYFRIGHSVGLSIVVADELISGAEGEAGSISHLPARIFANSLSDASLTIEESLQTSRVLSEIHARGEAVNVDEPSLRDAISHLNRNQNVCDVLRHESRRIACVLAFTGAVLNPALIILGGTVGSMPEIIEMVRGDIQEYLPNAAPIMGSELRELAPAYGAIAIALKEARGEMFKLARRVSSRVPALPSLKDAARNLKRSVK